MMWRKWVWERSCKTVKRNNTINNNQLTNLWTSRLQIKNIHLIINKSYNKSRSLKIKKVKVRLITWQQVTLVYHMLHRTQMIWKIVLLKVMRVVLTLINSISFLIKSLSLKKRNWSANTTILRHPKKIQIKNQAIITIRQCKKFIIQYKIKTLGRKYWLITKIKIPENAKIGTERSAKLPHREAQKEILWSIIRSKPMIESRSLWMN